MAKIFNIETDKDELLDRLMKMFQSANINFLFGSGASYPAISVAGDIEAEISSLFQGGKNTDAEKKINDFLHGIQAPMNDLIRGAANANNDTVLASHREFLSTLQNILVERKSSTLRRQATVFTTNYDLFFEKASESLASLVVNDGFKRSPNLSGKCLLATEAFFDATLHTGTLYNYTVEIPAINLVKIHGSLSWARRDDEIYFEVSSKDALTDADKAEHANIKKYNDKFSLILPQKGKFRDTLMDRVYYDLLRLYSNQMDKENTLLIAFGFSFVDEHIFDITKRALKNPTLKLVIFSYDEASAEKFKQKFSAYNNAEIVTPSPGKTIDFAKFNEALQEAIPAARAKLP